MTLNITKLKEAAEKATPGPWHHCQPFQRLEKTKTIHGTIPAQRVDYVSTWPDAGTPSGHRVIIPMEGRENTARSEDMAFIALANPATILALIERLESAEGALDRIAHECTIRRDGNAVQTVADMKAIARAHMEKHNG